MPNQTLGVCFCGGGLGSVKQTPTKSINIKFIPHFTPWQRMSGPAFQVLVRLPMAVTTKPWRVESQKWKIDSKGASKCHGVSVVVGLVLVVLVGG